MRRNPEGPQTLLNQLHPGTGGDMRQQDIFYTPASTISDVET
jgi:hypothetical protein